MIAASTTANTFFFLLILSIFAPFPWEHDPRGSRIHTPFLNRKDVAAMAMPAGICRLIGEINASGGSKSKHGRKIYCLNCESPRKI
jgi:hypothetical protein